MKQSAMYTRLQKTYKEGRTEGGGGGVCRTVFEQKKQRITGHGYQNFITDEIHESRRITVTDHEE